MADTKISALGAAATLAGGEALPLVQGGTTLRTSPAQLAAFARANAHEQVAFAATVPLDGAKIMAPQVIAGALAFAAPAGPIAGASAYVRLIADGVHAPTFGGFVEHGSSAGFVNTAGLLNTVSFWFDGVTAWVAVQQPVNTTPLAMTSAAITNSDANHIVVTFPQTLDAGVVPPAAAFALAGSGAAVSVTGVAITGTQVTLALSRAALAGETFQLRYTAPASGALVDANGNAVVGTVIAVTNATGQASATYLRFDHATSPVTEAADSGGGYDYGCAGVSSSYTPAASAYSSLRLAAGSDGWFDVTLPVKRTPGVIVGVTASTAPTAYSDGVTGLYDDGGSGYSVLGGSAIATVVPAAGDIIRFERVSGLVTARISKDKRTSWAAVATWSNAGVLVPFIQFGDASQSVKQPTQSGAFA